MVHQQCLCSFGWVPGKAICLTILQINEIFVLLKQQSNEKHKSEILCISHLPPTRILMTNMLNLLPKRGNFPMQLLTAITCSSLLLKTSKRFFNGRRTAKHSSASHTSPAFISNLWNIPGRSQPLVKVLSKQRKGCKKNF